MSKETLDFVPPLPPKNYKISSAFSYNFISALTCVYLIEGYMKADIVHFFTGQTVLAIPGVTSLQHLEKTLKELTGLGVRHVMTCFDMDYLKNWHVEAAYVNLVNLLGGLPLTFGTYLWSPDYNGLDDFIWEFFMEKRPLE